MRFVLVTFIGILSLLMACDEQELKSTCAPDGPCEAFLLLNCDCCAADRVEACRMDRQTACATGRLQLTQSVEECQQSVEQIMAVMADGGNYCEGFDESQLESQCNETIIPPEMGGMNMSGGE